MKKTLVLLILAFIVFNVADYLLTHTCLMLGCFEGNPLYPIEYAWVAKLVACTVIPLFAYCWFELGYRRVALGLLSFFSLAFFVAVTNNFIILQTLL